jgi:hypothetical protein
MTKRIMAVGNGDELHEAVNGRVYRHVYDDARSVISPFKTTSTARPGPIAAANASRSQAR